MLSQAQDMGCFPLKSGPHGSGEGGGRPHGTRGRAQTGPGPRQLPRVWYLQITGHLDEATWLRVKRWPSGAPVTAGHGQRWAGLRPTGAPVSAEQRRAAGLLAEVSSFLSRQF